MVFTKFGNTGFGFLATLDAESNKVFVVFKGDVVIRVFSHKNDAMSFMWAMYQKELDAELAKEAFFELKEEETDLLLTVFKEQKYQEYIEGLLTPEPTPAPTTSTFKPK
ncbi:hypothetical protein AB4525_08305 [Vibrio breoganii]